jgi:hypothetical protein
MTWISYDLLKIRPFTVYLIQLRVISPKVCLFSIKFYDENYFDQIYFQKYLLKICSHFQIRTKILVKLI